MSLTKEFLLPLLRNITNARFYATERGYQGQLVALLEQKVHQNELFNGATIVEQEYQKTMKHHGIRQRPDIIIHVPIEANLTLDRTQYNYYVIALKLEGGNENVREDFGKLDEMFERLNYPEGVFININAYPNRFLDNYTGAFENRLHELSICLFEGDVKVSHSYFEDGILKTELS